MSLQSQKISTLKDALLRIQELEEQNAYLLKQLYGAKKEKTPRDHPGQLNLFEDRFLKEAQVAEEVEKEVEEEVITYRRKRPQGRKKAILEQFPQEDVHFRLEGEACQCQHCHQPLREIGQDLIRQEVNYIPAHIQTRNLYQHAYKCDHCSQNSLQDIIKKAPIPNQAVPGGLGSSSLVTETLYLKYCQKVPNYRQEAHWRREKLFLSRSTLCNWHMHVSQNYFQPLADLLLENLRQQTLVHADETPFKVLEHKERQTDYYWIFKSHAGVNHPVVYFAHFASRAATCIETVLKDFKGYIQCDMYSAYRQYHRDHEDIQLAACWAHLRRRFYDALPEENLENSFAYQALVLINKLFAFERDWQDLNTDERYHKRRHQSLPLVNHLYQMIRAQIRYGPAQGKLKTALNYALNHETHFRTFLESGAVALSNNSAERSIKSFVMLRKNQLFAQSAEGAQAGAVIQTLLETAKANGLDERAYLNYLLDHLPQEVSLATVDLSCYLPWSEEVQRHCQFPGFPTY